MAAGVDNSKTTPKDALVMASILKEMGVSEYEPRVINQMLEFSYRYITDVLEDARVCSLHASKKQIDLDDVKLAVERKLDHSFTSPPPREFLLEVARMKNGQPLPLIQEKSGLRLPPDRYCLTGCNYRLKSGTNAQKKGPSTHHRLNVITQKTPGSVPQSIGAIKSGISTARDAMLANQRLVNASLAQQNVMKVNEGKPRPTLNPLNKGMNVERQDVLIKTEKAPKSSTVTSLPSMEETAASAQTFPNLLKRKRDGDDQDYDEH